MTHLTFIDPTEQPDLPFKIVKDRHYEPLDCKQIDGEWHYLIHKDESGFEYWYEEIKFISVNWSDEEMGLYVKELIELAENDLINH